MIISGEIYEGVLVERTHNGWLVANRHLYQGYTKREAVRQYKRTLALEKAKSK